jgi:hypothetical protein
MKKLSPLLRKPPLDQIFVINKKTIVDLVVQRRKAFAHSASDIGARVDPTLSATKNVIAPVCSLAEDEHSDLLQG